MRIVENSNHLEAAIRECFASDSALLSTWHIEAPTSLEQAVSRTINDVETTFDLSSFNFYEVYEGPELAGYFGTEFGKYVNLIFVKPEFRNSGFMKEFWTAVEDSVESPFYTAVYSKNTPAIEFYRKHGEKIKDFEIDGKKLIAFKFEKKVRS